MFDLHHLFISAALAQDAAPTTPEGGASALMNYLPFILIFVVFYALVIRPQQNKLAQQEKMIKALQRGDRVLTSGGIHGKIVRLEGDDHLILEIAEGVHVKSTRASIQGLEAKTQPVANSDNDKK